MTTSTHHGASTSTHLVSTSQAADTTTTPIHKRTYQACIPCRGRKVRCDLGPVDDPHEPPCVRCRRESKECYFSATRRKRKADGEGSDLGEEDQAIDEYAARNGRKSAKRHGSMGNPSPGLQHHQRSLTSGSFSTTSPLDGYNPLDGESYQQPGPYATSGALGRSEDGQDHEVTNVTAATLFQSPINIPGDALHLLLKASGQSEDLERRDTASQVRRPTAHLSQNSASMQGNHRPAELDSLNNHTGQQYPSNIDPAIAGDRAENGRTPVPKETLNVWSRLRFVRAGWFTAREGIMYMDYFYQFISPLTPISLPKIRSHMDHPRLLKDEPMLTITMLTIASRYLKLPGPGGQTRSFMIHERLWNYLQGMITCMFWGQEQFGGGFCGAGTRRLGQTNVIKGGLRTLGTIESLLLLNEFHPRSMHFPPRDDDDEILAPAEDDSSNGQNHGSSADDLVSSGDPTIANWSEPALRSDRICWSLIGTSYVLAYELGIFGTYSDGVQSADGRVKREGGSPEYCRRADRIERLLYVFVVQAAGRFGLPSMYSDDVNRFTLANLHNGSPPDGSPLPPEPVDKTQMLWVELMVIMKTCNDQLFTTRDQTATLIQSGGYVQRLQDLQPLLQSWYRRFETLEVPKHARCIIAIEYHYISLYINSLALQAVLEQWTTKVNAMPPNEGPASPTSSISSSFASLYSRNEQYIKEVIDSSRIVLRHVVEGLLPDDQLKHAPVRTYFRIISAAMFLLKTFALGGKQDEVAISLRLLDDTVRALRTSVVDDVHLCLRIADLLERLTRSVRSQFVRLPPRSLSSPEQARRTAQQPYNNNFDNNGTAFNSPDRFPYRTNTGDVFQNPLAGISRTYNNPHDSNISIMPPIGNTYANNNNNNNNNNNINATYNFTNPSPYSPDRQQASPQQHLQQYAMSNNSNDFNMPSEEDWLTLDLNRLLDTSGMNGGDNQWFGAFGPETHNNLEVLGKLVNDQYRGDGYGEAGMGF